MDDGEITLSLAADLRALLPVVRHHITMLSTPATARQDPTAGPELARLTGAMADNCAQAEADDCALLLYGLHDHFTTSPGALQPRYAALVWDALTFVQERIDAMGAQVTPRTPTAVLRAQAERMAQALVNTPNSSIGGHSSKLAGSGSFPLPTRTEAVAPPNDRAAEVAEPLTTAGSAAVSNSSSAERTDAALTEDELAILQVFQVSPLRHPAHGALVQAQEDADQADADREDADQAETAPLPRPGGIAGTAANPLPAAPRGQDSASYPSWHAPTADELDYIPPEMKQLFLVESSDDAQDLRLALIRYQQHPDESAALAAMGRIAHKIKGAAATLGFETLARVLLSFEDVIKAVQSRHTGAGVRAGDVLVQEMALVQEALDTAASETTPNTALVAEARRLFEALVAGDAPIEGRADAVPMSEPAGQDMPGLVEAPEADGTATGESESYLRVDIRRLDELMRHISSLAVNRAALTQSRAEAIRLQAEMDQALTQLSGLSSQFLDLQPILRGSVLHETSSDNSARRSDTAGGLFRIFGGSDRMRGAAAGGAGRGPAWDALELDQFTEFDHALRKLNEVVADLDTTSRQLRLLLVRLSQLSEEQSALAGRMQRDVMHVRLVPLKSMMPRLELETLRLGPLTEKLVAFSVRGEMTEIDRNISESLAGPLLQLVRNAVVHGIESPEERREMGKPEVGQIWMHAYYVGSEVIIELGDDGRGINAHRLAAAALAHGDLDADAARSLNTADALELMFLPGITTLKAAQVVGGRGIGLDDVRMTIAALKGSITVRSEPGQGTVFRIRVPISLSIVHVLRVDAAEQQYAVPFSSVQRTLSLSGSELLVSAPSAPNGDESRMSPLLRHIRIERSDSAPVIGELPESERYEEVPVFALAELLGIEHTMRDPQLALLVEAGRRRAALLVDAVHEDSEVVVQALPSHLRRKALRGGSVTPSGQLLLLLDLPELIAGVLDGTRTHPALRSPQVRPAVLAPRVLVVDDSVSIRRTLEHTLGRAGFEVQVARDGIEALELMMTSAPRVLVLDIEMPRLDGFELLSIVRGSPQFAGVRVAMLTSRAADKHIKHARQLGAEAYLVKPCPQETLVATVRELLAEPATVS